MDFKKNEIAFKIVFLGLGTISIDFQSQAAWKSEKFGFLIRRCRVWIGSIIKSLGYSGCVKQLYFEVFRENWNLKISKTGSG